VTPVYQTIGGYPYGNCLQACIATVLDLPLAEVPHFADGDPTADVWWSAIREWALPRDINPCWIDPEKPDEAHLVQLLMDMKLPYLAVGPSPGGNYGHCVVMQEGRYVHDPSGRDCYLAGPPWLLVVFERRKDEPRG
jgi:hypothetical protein